jgi:hypothetical protein
VCVCVCVCKFLSFRFLGGLPTVVFFLFPQYVYIYIYIYVNSKLKEREIGNDQ